MPDLNTILLLGGFIIVAVAARYFAVFFARFKWPLITGLIFIGILSGPHILDLIKADAPEKLFFINEISLAFIAFAASSELYLKELRNRFNSIKWITIGQILVVFLLSTLAVYFTADFIPFMRELPVNAKIAYSLLAGTIFVASSPASAIAIVNEMRAKGPFTQTILGVTVVKDFIVIILFSINLSIALALINGNAFTLKFLFILLIDISLSFAMGLALGKVLQFILARRWSLNYKTIFILLAGFLIYRMISYFEIFTEDFFGTAISLEALLICIIGSFMVVNYTRYRTEFIKIINDAGPYIYVAFFTLAGATLSLDILIDILDVALLLFAVRMLSLIIGSILGGLAAGDPARFNKVGWMPYLTQAGVSLGLATLVAYSFSDNGDEFATLIVSVIIISQVVGPPFFKWAINIVGEGHRKASTPSFDGIHDAIIFGLESQSIALARQLQDNGWKVKLVTFQKGINKSDYPDLMIKKVNEITLKTLEDLDTRLAEAIVCMLTDDENYHICELVYEHIGTRDMVVRLNNRYNFDKFHQLGALIVDPTTAMVSLMDHFVRSPQAASLLLGMDPDQDTMDIEVQNPNLHGIALRDLRLSSDLIILSVYRGGHQLISHGYTRLRLGDYITVVGSKKSLENISLRFAAQ